MNCIIVDDEPLAREGIKILIEPYKELQLVGQFHNADATALFLKDHSVDLIFLDIQMPGTNGMDFAKFIPQNTLVIFTTAYSEFALESYEVDALDYLLKPIMKTRFDKAVKKALSYREMLSTGLQSDNSFESVDEDYIFVRSDRKICKIDLKKILFIGGLKDYVVIHTDDQRYITAINMKTIYEKLPKSIFVRVSKSYVVNVKHIDSFDNNDIQIGKYEIPIGGIYRNEFFEKFVMKKMLNK
jgi:DNA-binding LytR/AlgR family response regulator